MSESLDDLWPDDLADDIPTSPRDVLQQQAALLGPKTKNVVLAEVKASTEDSQFFLAFQLRVPALGHYRYVLFTLMHYVELYPVYTEGGNALEDETELKEYIGKMLQKPSTVKIIRSLISQARNQEVVNEMPF